MKRLTIDGSAGEGGGQVLRSALSLSVITGKPFLIEKIRAGRRKPGLMRQHRTALIAAAEICGADVTGGELGSRELTFDPGEVRAGDYRFSVGTAGSACLVLQTVLPPLLRAGAPSTLVLEGGTHNPWAPPFEFLQQTFLPLLCRMGPAVKASLKRHGFYPAGGGRFSVEITPTGALEPLELLERGALLERRGVVLSANLPDHIARREVEQLIRKLDWPESAFEVREVTDSAGPGNVAYLALEHEAITEVFTAFGEKGVPVNRVMEPAVKAVRTYLSSEAPVGVNLADQLLIPLAMAGGGAFNCVGLSKHTMTNAAVIEQFFDLAIKLERRSRGDVLVTVG